MNKKRLQKLAGIQNLKESYDMRQNEATQLAARIQVFMDDDLPEELIQVLMQASGALEQFAKIK